MRLEEPVPIKIKQGSIPLRIESYELFQMVARATIKHLEMKKSKDPNAGRPIIGTDAARVLDPVRNRQAHAEAAKTGRPHASERKEAKAKAKAGQGPEGRGATRARTATWRAAVRIAARTASGSGST